MSNLDTRFVPFGDSLRADSRTLKGYAIVFNTWAEILPGFMESIAPEAVNRSMNNGDDIRALVDHNKEKVIGRRSAGTLQLTADAKGLAFEINVPDTSVGNDLLTSIQRGDYDGMSFSFYQPKYDIKRQDGKDYGTVRDMRIREISAVSFPAYADTSVALRSLQEWQTSQEKPASDLLIEFNQRIRERKR